MSPRDGYRSRSLKYCNPVPAKSKCKYTEEMSALINPAGKTHIIEVVLYHLVPSQCITATYRYPGNPHSSYHRRQTPQGQRGNSNHSWLCQAKYLHSCGFCFSTYNAQQAVTFTSSPACLWILSGSW